MKLTLPPKTSAPPDVRPVVRLTLPGKPPLHVMRAQAFVANARAYNTILVNCLRRNGGLENANTRYLRECIRTDMAAARAALAQGKV